MAVKAYILIDTEVGMTASVSKTLSSLEFVQAADAVTGSHDVIAVIEAPDLNAVGDFVTGRLHTIKGVTRTVTCLALGNS